MKLTFVHGFFVGHLSLFYSLTNGYPTRIPIQSFTMASDLGLSMTLNYTVNRLNSAMPNTFLLHHKNKFLRIASDDGWSLINKICDELQTGFMIMSAGEIQPRAYEAYSIIANALEIPFLNWELSPLTSEPIMNTNYEVSLKPPNAQLIADLILLKEWKKIVYLSDSKIANQGIV